MAGEPVAEPASKTRRVIFWARVPLGRLQRVSAQIDQCRRCAQRVRRLPRMPVCRRPPLPRRVAWAGRATATEYGSLAPIILSYAEAGDPFAQQIVTEAVSHVDVLVRALVAFGAPRISLLGGLAPRLVRWLSPEILRFLS